MEEAGLKNEGKKDQRPAFHTKSVRWKYSDGSILVIGEDGVARRAEPKQFRTKKERQKARAAGRKLAERARKEHGDL
jgi:hypothetical protein